MKFEDYKKTEEYKKLKKELDKDSTLKDKDREVYIKRAHASYCIAEILKKLNLDAGEMLKILVSSACGITCHSPEPFGAMAYVLNCMAEYYEFYQAAIFNDLKKKHEDKD